jgi:hypothetical protein
MWKAKTSRQTINAPFQQQWEVAQARFVDALYPRAKRQNYPFRFQAKGVDRSSRNN